jgi:hypothetical protein
MLFGASSGRQVVDSGEKASSHGMAQTSSLGLPFSALLTSSRYLIGI